MIAFILYYLVVPLFIIWFVQWFFRKHAKRPILEAIRTVYERQPIEKGFFRVVRFNDSSSEPEWLGDFETQPEAVDAAYAARKVAAAEGRKSRFLILNDRGEDLEEVDAD